jgi:hypothetical protein
VVIRRNSDLGSLLNSKDVLCCLLKYIINHPLNFNNLVEFYIWRVVVLRGPYTNSMGPAQNNGTLNIEPIIRAGNL